MINAAVLDAMLAAGCSAEQIVAAVKADQQDGEARAKHKRESDAARKRRQRERHAMSRGHGVTPRDAVDTPSSPEVSPQTPFPNPTNPIPPSPPSGAHTPTASTPRSELEAVLSPLHAGAVLDHRKRIGKPMTPRAAQLLARKFARCADPDAAADAMIANGWQGFEPEWMDNRQQRAGPSPPAVKLADRAAELAREFGAANVRSREGSSSVPALVPHLSAVSGR